MATNYPTPPTIPQTPSREEQNANQEAFLSFWNIFHDKSKAFADWLVGFIPWIATLHTDVTNYRNEAVDAKNKAVVAKQDAESAKNAIENYVIPTNAVDVTQITSLASSLAPVSGFVDRELDLAISETDMKVGIKNRFIKVGDKVYDLYGPELVTNGDFINGTTGWNEFDGVYKYVANGKAYVNSTSTFSRIVSPVSVEVGKTYKISGYVEKGTSNVWSIYFNKAHQGRRTDFGYFEYTLTVDTPSSLLLFADYSSNGYVVYDNISVREVKSLDFSNNALNTRVETSATTTASVNSGDYVVLDRTNLTGQVDEVYRAKVNTTTGDLLTDTTKFEVRDQTGVTTQIGGFITVDDNTGAIAAETEIMYNDITEDEANLDRDAGFVKNGFSIVSDGLLSKGTKKYIPIGLFQC